MRPWNQRPIEVANLFNPAFCSLLLKHTVDSYQRASNQGLDLSLTFIILPIVLHKPTRQALPGITTKLNVWMQRHHEVRIGFSERMSNMVPLIKEALIFSMHHELIRIDQAGHLIVGDAKLKKYEVSATSEAALCVKKADFIGRWFADAGNAATILTMWGVKIL
jgi:uncharacterized ubiquitin-like protein YukD